MILFTTFLLLAGASVPGDDPLPLGPLGGSATSVWVDPADAEVVLVTHPLRGLLRSEDGGTSFAPFGTGLPDDPGPSLLTPDPRSDKILYVAAGNAIFRSFDAGETWASLALAANGFVRSIALPKTGEPLLACTDSEVWRAETADDAWSIVDTGTILGNVTFAAGDPDTAFYGAFDGVYKSTDGGQTFDPAGTFTEWTQTLTVDPEDPSFVLAGTFGGVFASTDGGANFEPASDGLPQTSALFFAWEPDAVRVWVGLLDGLWFSDSGGARWQDGNDGFPSPAPIPLGVAFASSSDRFVVNEASNGGLWRTFGGALPWVHVAFADVPVLATLVAGPGGTRAASSFNGVFVGAPGETLHSSAWQFDFGTHTEVMKPFPLDPRRWLVGGVGSFIDNATVVLLEDNGETFVDVTCERFGAGRTETIEFDPFEPFIVLAGFFPAEFGDVGIVRSIDAGKTFDDVPGTAGYATRALTFDPFTKGRVLAYMTDNRWAESTDSGATFGALQTPFPGANAGVILAFDPFTPERLYRGVIGDSGPAAGLLRSDAGTGGSWTSLGVSLHERSELLLHPEIPELLFVSDDEGAVLISGDGGDSFEPIFQAPSGQASGLALDTLDGSLVIGTTDASAWELPGASPFVVLGPGTPGSGDFVPRLVPVGGLPQPGNAAFGLAADRLLGGRNSLLLVSVHEGALPRFGGTLFALPPFLLVQTIPTGGTSDVAGSGSFTQVLGIPDQLSLLGISVVSQLVVADSGGPLGQTRVLSNGLRITFGP